MEVGPLGCFPDSRHHVGICLSEEFFVHPRSILYLGLNIEQIVVFIQIQFFQLLVDRLGLEILRSFRLAASELVSDVIRARGSRLLQPLPVNIYSIPHCLVGSEWL